MSNGRNNEMNKENKVKAFLKSNVMLIILILLIIVFSFMNPNFLTFRNLMNICTQNAYFVIASIGVAMIMIKKTDSSTEVKELEKGTVDYIPDVTDADKISSIIQS